LYSLPKIYDAHIIKADYLIENIDLSFKMWKERPWNQDLPFEDFCELILPYRIDDEPLSNWRQNYFEVYFSALDSLSNCTDPLRACNALSKELSKKEFFYTVNFDMPHLSAHFLLEHHVGFCREISGCLRNAGLRHSGHSRHVCLFSRVSRKPSVECGKRKEWGVLSFLDKLVRDG